MDFIEGHGTTIMDSARMRYTWAIVGILVASSLFSPSAWGGEAEDQFDVAAGEYSLGRWELAAVEFQTFLDLYPEHAQAVRAHFFLAEALVQQDKFGEALPFYQAYLEFQSERAYVARARFRVGEIARLQNNVEVAQEGFTQFIEGYPEDPLNAYALVYLGQILAQKEAWGEAKRLLEDALARYPEGPMHEAAQFSLAVSYAGLGDAETAIALYASLVQSESGLAPKAQLRIGKLHFNRGENEACEEALATLVERYSDSSFVEEAQFWQAMALLRQDKGAEAGALLESIDVENSTPEFAANCTFYAGEAWRAAGDNEKAKPLYALAAHNWPAGKHAARSSALLIALHLEGGDIESAQTEILHLERQNPNSPALSAARRQLAKAFIQNEQFEEAIAAINSMRDAPNASEDPIALYLLGLAHLNLHQPEAALEAITSLRGRPLPNSLNGSVDLLAGAALVELERYEEAIEPLRSYLALYPEGADVPKCRADLVIAYSGAGEWEAASELLRVMESLDENRDAYAAAVLKMAKAAQEEGDMELALETYHHLLTEEIPEEYARQARRELAWAQLSSGDAEASAATFQAIVENSSDENEIIEAALNQGRIFEGAKDYDSALAAYQLIVEQFDPMPQTPEALLGCARAYHALGEFEKGEEACDSLISLYPDWSKLDRVLNRWSWILVDQNRTDEAAAVWLRIHAEMPESRFWSDASYRVAEHAYRQEDYEAAELVLAALLEGASESNILAYAYLLQGQIYAAQGEWEQVAPPMVALLEAHPQHPLALSARFWQGEAAYQLNDLERAESLFESIRQESDELDASWSSLLALREAEIFARHRNWDAAIAKTESIAEGNPQFSQIDEVHYLIGRCFAAQGKFTLARESYSTVINREREARSETAAKAQWMIGESYFHQQNYHEAIRAYHRVEHLYPYPEWQSAALLQSAKCYQAQGKEEEAEQALQDVIERFGDSTYAFEAAELLLSLREGGANRR